MIENQATSVQSNKINSNQSNSKSTIKKVFLPAGTSFRFLGLYEDVSNLMINGKKNRFATATRKTENEETIRKQFLLGNNCNDKTGGLRFIKCLALAGDHLLANQMVFIPTTQTGR